MKQFKPCPGCPTPAKCKAAGKCMKKKTKKFYTKPTMRKRLFEKIKAGSKGGDPGEWSARKAQLLASEYKKAGGGYKS